MESFGIMDALRFVLEWLSILEMQHYLMSFTLGERQ